MTTLPPSVLLCIAQHVTDGRDLIELLITSRLFHFAVLKVLHQEALIYFTRDEEDLKNRPSWYWSSTDKKPIPYPLLRGSAQTRLIREPGNGGNNRIDVATFLYKFDISLQVNKAWIGSVLEAAVNLKWLRLYRMRDDHTAKPNTQSLDGNRLGFSALVRLKPKFQLHFFATNLPGDEHMQEFLRSQSSITTLEWNPDIHYPFGACLFRSPSLVPNLHTLSCSATTDLFLRHGERRIERVEYVGQGFGHSVRFWRGKANIRALRIANMSSVQMDEFLEEGMGLTSLEYLCADSSASPNPYMVRSHQIPFNHETLILDSTNLVGPG